MEISCIESTSETEGNVKYLKFVQPGCDESAKIVAQQLFLGGSRTTTTAALSTRRQQITWQQQQQQLRQQLTSVKCVYNSTPWFTHHTRALLSAMRYYGAWPGTSMSYLSSRHTDALACVLVLPGFDCFQRTLTLWLIKRAKL